MKKGKLIGVSTLFSLGASTGMMFAPKKGEELRKDVGKKIKKVGKKIENTSDSNIKKNLKMSLENINKRLDDLEFEKEKKKLNRKANEIKQDIEEIIKACSDIKDDILTNTAVKLKEQAQDKIECILKKMN